MTGYEISPKQTDAQEAAPENHHESGHGNYRSYIIGFILSVILTVIPFAIVMGETFGNPNWAIAIIFILGTSQMLVHLHYFMHVSLRVDEGWQAMSLIFTVLIIVIIMAGSIWIMFHLHENMMPAHEQIERIRNLP